MLPLSHRAVSLVEVCPTAPVLVHCTDWPTYTVTVEGTKAKSCIATGTTDGAAGHVAVAVGVRVGVDVLVGVRVRVFVGVAVAPMTFIVKSVYSAGLESSSPT